MNSQRLMMVLMVVVVVLSMATVAFVFVRTNGTFSNQNSGTNWQWADNWNNNQIPPQKPDVKPDPKPDVKPEKPRPQGQVTTTSYAEALQKSGEFGMPVLAFFETSWCGYCKKMEEQTLPSKPVVSAMVNYVFVKVDAEKERAAAKKFGVKYLPTYVITNVKEESLKQDGGFKSPDEFATWLNNPNLYKQPKSDSVKPDSPKPDSPKTPPKDDSPKPPRKKLFPREVTAPEQPPESSVLPDDEP